MAVKIHFRPLKNAAAQKLMCLTSFCRRFSSTQFTAYIQKQSAQRATDTFTTSTEQHFATCLTSFREAAVIAHQTYSDGCGEITPKSNHTYVRRK